MEKNSKWKKQVMLFLISQNISLFGSSVVGFSIIWYITLETSSGIWITVSTIATLVPQVLISLWAGVAADRYNRKWLIMISDGFTALATLAAFLAFQSGKESVTLLIVISFFRSVGGGIQAPAVNALYPQIVPENQLVRINGLNQTINNILLLVSPAAGGVILGTMGIRWTFLVDVVTASAAILIMSRMKISAHKVCIHNEVEQKGEAQKMQGCSEVEQEVTAQGTQECAEGTEDVEEEKQVWDIAVLEEKAGRSSVIQELKDGITYTRQHPLLKNVMICYAVMFVLITPISLLSPLMVSRTFGEEVWKLTANEVFWTVGSLIGGALVVWKGEIKNKIATIAMTLVGFGITFTLMGCSRSLAVYLILDCICGMFLPFMITAQTVLLQTNTEPEYMGRVFSLLQFVSQGVMPIAILGFGPLGDIVKIQYLIITCGVLLALWGVWFKRVTS